MNLNAKALLIALSLSLAQFGCQSSSGSEGGGGAISIVSDTNQGLAISCDSALAANPATVQLQGPSTAQPSVPATYSVNCAAVQSKVMWRGLSISAAATSGSQLTSVYQQPGKYVVSAQVQSQTGAASVLLSQQTVVAGSVPAISGPEVAMVGEDVTYQLVLPTGYNLSSVSWDFGDGSAVTSQSTNAPVVHHGATQGLYKIQATVTGPSGTSLILTQNLNVIVAYEGFSCANQASLSSPSEALAGTPVSMSIFVPSCLTQYVTSVQWDFGDGTGAGTNTSVQHTYITRGHSVVQVKVFSNFVTGGPWLVLTAPIDVTSNNPLSCPADHQTQTVYSDPSTSQIYCGISGTQSQTVRTVTDQTCLLQGGELLWVNQSSHTEIVSTGACQNQSCQLPDGSLLANNASKVFYTNALPSGACSDVAVTRTCQNGVLSGSAQATSSICQNGCPGFGPNGASQTGVTTGTLQVPVACAFGETGITSTYSQISDQTCQAGTVVSTNSRQGVLQTAGVCPTYHWAETGTWSTCTADCGGTQTEAYVCHDNKEQVAPVERCSGAAPVTQRVCDGNPAAVVRTDSTNTSEQANSSALCPANQLGVIINERTVTTAVSYACVNHAVQPTGTQVSNGPWQAQSYCRDYVAHRCSQDSLNDTQAIGRYNWMVACASKDPMIKTFLDEFSNVKASGGYSISSGVRRLYPTFMNTAPAPVPNSSISGSGNVTSILEKPWIAPTDPKASCEIPSTVYIAAVCLASCATPEQEILVAANQQFQARYMPFLTALNQNEPQVATLQSQSAISSTSLASTKVDQWVDELIATDHQILEFHMKSGGVLRVTPNHPLIAEDGSVKLAENFVVGDSLVQLGGVKDPVVAINESVFYGKVYNLFVASSDLQKNVVVTNGYLNGTAFFQNEGAVNVNRVILRNSLTQGVFAK